MKPRMKKALAAGTTVVLLLLAGGYWALHAVQERMTAALASLAEEAQTAGPGTDSARQAPASGQDDSRPTSGNAGQSQTSAQASAPIPQAVGKPSDPKSGSAGYKAEISEGKAKEVQDQISLAEQVKITTVLLKKLDGNDLKQLQNMFNKGVSLEEKRKAKELIMEKLSQEEYDELIAIASKYGLSKGKSYEESLREKK